MLDQLIHTSIRYRNFVILISLAFFAWGLQQTLKMNVDVFPDLTAPTVTLISDAHGLSPHEVETSIVFPLESALGGASGVRRIRSNVGLGMALTWVEFDWGVDIYQARQIVSEKLQLVRASIPEELQLPTLTPIAGIMGEIYFLGLQSKRHGPMDIKSVADWQIRRRLLTIPGIAQVINIGGRNRQLQVILDPLALRIHHLTALGVYETLKKSSENAAAGFLLQADHEYLIHVVGRAQTIENLEMTVVKTGGERAILLKEIAKVQFGPSVVRGDASVNANPAVVLAIQKQPGVNTLKLTKSIDQALDELQGTIPEGMEIKRNLLRQADFIQVAVNNVMHALRDGSLLVILILGIFLFNGRATLITVLAIPLSMLVAAIFLKLIGSTLNTMTLGGLAIAVGSLVDDAIIDVENVVRRLRLNHLLPDSQKKSTFEVVFQASKEIRGAIFFATLIIMLVFVPLFFLSGVEGRLLIPLGIAYIVSLAASLLIALTLTPALCMILLPKTCEKSHQDPRTIYLLKQAYQPILKWSLANPSTLACVMAVLISVSAIMGSRMGQSFLPEFQEGALTISAVTLPGTALHRSNEVANEAEKLMLNFPEVLATSRRTGHAEQDEHASDINSSEIDAKLSPNLKDKAGFMGRLREKLSHLKGLNITIGQPISHRIDHMLSGTRANIAIKIFGQDLKILDGISKRVLNLIEGVDGVVDASVETQTMAPAVSVRLLRDRLALHQFSVEDVIETLEIVFAGHEFSNLIEGNIRIPMVLKTYEEPPTRFEEIEQVTLKSPSGSFIPLSELASIEWSQVPGRVSREDSSRKLVVMCNVADRDLVSVVKDIQKLLAERIKLPGGYSIKYGGQFEAAIEASKKLSFYSALVFFLILGLLYMALNSLRDAFLVLVNLPLALIGGIVGIVIYDNTMSVASIIGLIALFGIATRNGLMLVTHIRNLYYFEGIDDVQEAVMKGSMERLAPILMTALASALALVPLALSQGQPGSEIQTPMAYVMLFGLISSTFLNMLILPVLYLHFGDLKIMRDQEE